MSDNINYNHRFTYENNKDLYTFRMRKSHKGWWWLLLLLLLPLLLIRCQHDITVTVIDNATKKPVPDVKVEAEYTSHILLQDGKFLNHKSHPYSEITDSEGKAVLKDVKCCLFSYIFYGGSKIHITADDLKSVDKSYHYTRNVTIELENVDCEIDIVMVIDNTGSMSATLDMVKENALNFSSKLKEACIERHRNIKGLHMQVISYGELNEDPIIKSDVFNLPKDETAYKNFVSSIHLTDGGDTPESGLEALAMAIQSDWHKSSLKTRHVIVVYTDAPSHSLDYEYDTREFYPKKMPKNFKELTKMWNGMDKDAKRLLLFAPLNDNDDSKVVNWSMISDKWDNVTHDDLNTILKSGYDTAIDAICKSL